MERRVGVDDFNGSDITHDSATKLFEFWSTRPRLVHHIRGMYVRRTGRTYCTSMEYAAGSIYHELPCEEPFLANRKALSAAVGSDNAIGDWLSIPARTRAERWKACTT